MAAALEEYDRNDVVKIVNRELDEALSFTTEIKMPKAILLAGQPGAGKTELSSMMISMMEGNVVFINGDEYRRYYPKYKDIYAEYGAEAAKYTSKLSAEVTEELIKRVSDRKRNIMIEGTGRTVDVPLKTAKLLSSKGYEVEMAILAVRPELSLASTLNRFYEMRLRGTIPRATALASHDIVVNALLDNLDYLYGCHEISKISLWNRNLELLYDSIDNKEPPSKALESEWKRVWSEDERQLITELLSELKSKDIKMNSCQSDAIFELEQRLKTALLNGQTQ